MAIQPRQFKALMEMVRTELASLREVVEKSSATISDQRIRQHQDDKETAVGIQRSIVGLHVPPHIQAHADTNQERRHRENVRVQKALAWATALAFLAAAIYAWEAHKQLGEMERSTRASEKAANAACSAAEAAKTQADTMRKQLEITSSASASVSDFTISEGTKFVSVAILNEGQSAATQIQGTVWISVKAIPNIDRTIGERKAFPFSLPNIPPPNRGSSPAVENHKFSDILTDHQWELVNQTKAAVVMELSFSYNNGFEVIQDGGYCKAYFGFPRVVIHHVNPVSEEDVGGFSTVPCDELPRGIEALAERRSAAEKLRRENPQR